MECFSTSYLPYFWPWYQYHRFCWWLWTCWLVVCLITFPHQVQTCLHATVCWNQLLIHIWSITIAINSCQSMYHTSFFCGKESLICGAVYLWTGGFEFAPLGYNALCNFSEFSGFFFNFFRNFCLFTRMANFSNSGLVLNALTLDKTLVWWAC